MTARVLRFAECDSVPWRNGRGMTREITREPSAGAFDWRVSVAEVAQDGEFSTFAGVDRIIMLCDGPAMTLTVAGTAHALRRHEPFAFAGESDTWCQVPGGATRDLNVMTRRAACTATVSTRRAGEDGIDIRGSESTMVIVLTDTVLVHPAAADPIQLTELDAVRLDAAERVRITGDALVAVIDIRTRPNSAQNPER